MTKPIEFGSFYKLLKGVIEGDDKDKKELQWLLAEYEHAKDATSAYDELGQIFCHHGIMELYDYTGTDNLQYITCLEKSIWDYLQIRMGKNLNEYMVTAMMKHANIHKLPEKISTKWNTSISEIEDNLEDLANYVSEGIIELII